MSNMQVAHYLEYLSHAGGTLLSLTCRWHTIWTLTCAHALLPSLNASLRHLLETSPKRAARCTERLLHDMRTRSARSCPA